MICVAPLDVRLIDLGGEVETRFGSCEQGTAVRRGLRAPQIWDDRLWTGAQAPGSPRGDDAIESADVLFVVPSTVCPIKLSSP